MVLRLQSPNETSAEFVRMGVLGMPYDQGPLSIVVSGMLKDILGHAAFYGPRFLICAYTVLSLAYLATGDFRRAAYWFGAAVITVSITY